MDMTSSAGRQIEELARSRLLTDVLLVIEAAKALLAGIRRNLS
jgi:hypothetical protein